MAPLSAQREPDLVSAIVGCARSGGRRIGVNIGRPGCGCIGVGICLSRRRWIHDHGFVHWRLFVDDCVSRPWSDHYVGLLRAKASCGDDSA